ncbi:MAG TPA: class I SAM-dependent methyltransferase [Anaerolineae bacterium]|nr:class I SAM-dependent methyltransferase [Anaerolineae bacterium]
MSLNLPIIPPPADKRLAIHINKSAQRALRQGHPWLFADAIEHHSHDGDAGDLAVIFDHKRRFLAIGLYDPHSPIRVRLLHHGHPTPIDTDWWTNQLITTLHRRAPLLADPTTTAFRLIHGENDGWPGLILDKYDTTLVLKLYTHSWFPYLPLLIPLIQAQHPFERLVLRLSRHLQDSQTFGLADGHILWGPPLTRPIPFLENNLHFIADLIHGQKTGFFLDQRDNRARVEALSQGKRVLNVFAYTGGFSLYAGRGGAQQVTSLDISAPALDMAATIWNMNRDTLGHTLHETIAADAFDQLEQWGRQQRQFDLIIVDPPSFATRQNDLPQARHAYQRLTRLVLPLLPPNATLVSASCTARLPATDFFQLILDTAAATGRHLTPFQRTHHPLDHPLGFPEGAYLKCLYATT